MESVNDEFGGFGEGFSGFPKRLPDDCVEYTLYIINSKLKTQKELLAQLEAVRRESLRLTDSLLREYIWQRDSFKLELESGKGTEFQHVRDEADSFRINVPLWSYKLRGFGRLRMAHCIYS